jgi:Zn-dependent protease
MPDFTGLGNGLIDVVLLLVILVVLVVIHELGHFVVARRAGVTVLASLAATSTARSTPSTGCR